MNESASAELPWEELDPSEFQGIDPMAPTLAAPGSGLKVLTLAARYAAGAPLWHDEDCSDHSIAVDRPVVDGEFEPERDFADEQTDEVDELELASV